MKYILLGLSILYSSFSFSDNFYVDIGYKKGSLLLPEKSSKLYNLIKKDNKSLVVTGSLLSRKGSKEIILLPPTMLEHFEIAGDNLVRVKNEDIKLKTSHFQIPTEQLILQVDFYFVDKSNVSGFAKGLESLARSYASATLTPAVSDVASSALELVSSVLLSNKEVSLKYRGGINLNQNQYTKKLYFDDTGKINETPVGGEITAATVEFDINGYSERKVHFNIAFNSQFVDDQAKDLFEKFVSVPKSDKDRKIESCEALFDHLKQTNTSKSATDLIAVAIDEARWPQDEIKKPCLKPEIAIDYRNKQGLSKIVNCVKSSCLMTKRLVIVSLGLTDFSKLKPFSGGVDVTSLSCFDSQKPKRIYSWKGFSPGDTFFDDDFDSYQFTTCIESNGNTDRFDHTITWFDKQVYSHGCEIATSVPRDCS